MNLRNELKEVLIKEIVGPDPHPAYIDVETKEEVLLRNVHGAPKMRYGAGMLFPQRTEFDQVIQTPQSGDEAKTDVINENPDQTSSEPETKKDNQNLSEDQGTEEPVGLANQFLPSAIGFTIRVKNISSKLLLNYKSAYYQVGNGEYPIKILAEGDKIQDKVWKDRTLTQPFWVRRPVFNKEPIWVDTSDLIKKKGTVFSKTLLSLDNDKPWLTLEIRNRSTINDTKEGFHTLTFSMVNSLKAQIDHRITDRYILFQNYLELKTDDLELIQPYKERVISSDTEEEEEMRLLYHKKRIYGIGHGCSVNWESDRLGNVTKVNTVVIPEFELAPINPTSHVELSMLELSDLGDWEKAKKSLLELESNYKEWINKQKIQIDSLDNTYRTAAKRNIQKCSENHRRIEKGISTLLSENEDSAIVRAFRWMNRAMIWQQQRSKTKQRRWIRKGKDFFAEELEKGEPKHATLKSFYESGWGRWRPFQLAFILMNLSGIIDPDSNERNIVDLIWFPTGGGKTEAYLGLAAFTILYRRLKGESEFNWEEYGGTSILMRYTLRLLTTQQYERASSLICACDLIRKKNQQYLGDEPISIGLWVGRSTTPNTNKDAINQFHNLEKSSGEEYNFIVLKCPCCGVQIGKIEHPTKHCKIKGIKKEEASGRVIFSCENSHCEYYDIELPLYIVDEDIYNLAPTLILGTVDKFAMLPWKIETGSLFGFRKRTHDQLYRISPPELIIQDELHLISGPLGTMVGLYEILVQALCTQFDYIKQSDSFSDVNHYGPKIVASSATISRAQEQVKSLYGTDNLNIFPPQGLSFGDTWFSQEQSDLPGRKYIGILAPGYQSGQTSVVRIYSALLQGVKNIEAIVSQKDFYWTLLGFFNSIRELGIASSLINADIAEYLRVLRQRKLISKEDWRYINRQIELTSRISSGKIPEYLKALEARFGGSNSGAVDVCLATNMIATGVDISRLGLMIVHGQPKTTAEYIQASSRVGRDRKGPGFVITLYSPSKPRDKSQYEQFQAYHSRIYSLVEPTSVTPFSINSRQRALHAVFFGLIRHFSKGNLRSTPSIPGNEKEFDHLVPWAKELILSRCKKINPDEYESTSRLLSSKVDYWKLGYDEYGYPGRYNSSDGEDVLPLMYALGDEVSEELKAQSLGTPTSMRGVDAEVDISIYRPFNLGKQDE